MVTSSQAFRLARTHKVYSLAVLSPSGPATAIRLAEQYDDPAGQNTPRRSRPLPALRLACPSGEGVAHRATPSDPVGWLPFDDYLIFERGPDDVAGFDAGRQFMSFEEYGRGRFGERSVACGRGLVGMRLAIFRFF